jgi:hypothetical protein
MSNPKDANKEQNRQEQAPESGKKSGKSGWDYFMAGFTGDFSGLREDDNVSRVLQNKIRKDRGFWTKIGEDIGHSIMRRVLKK